MKSLTALAPDARITIDLPAYAYEEGGVRIVPALIVGPLDNALLEAARSAAQDALPARDEGESEADWDARARAALSALGYDRQARRMSVSAAWRAAFRDLQRKTLARLIVEEVRHLGVEGHPVEPGGDGVMMLMADSYIAARFDEVVYGEAGARLDEGNG